MLSSICRTKMTQTFHDSYLLFQSSLIVVTSQYQEIAVVRFVGHLKCDNVNINYFYNVQCYNMFDTYVR